MSERADVRAERRRRLVAGIASRRRRSRALRYTGLLALLTGLGAMGILFVSVFLSGYTAFGQTHIRLSMEFNAEAVAPSGRYDAQAANFERLVRDALQRRFPDAGNRSERRALSRLLSIDAPALLQSKWESGRYALGERISLWLPASASIDMLFKGRIDRSTPEERRALTDRQLNWVDSLRADGDIRLRFNTAFFTNGDSREPELAGIRGAVAGSLLMLVITLLFAFPTGVAAAIYLEEFAPRNRLSDLIEANINNLAAVPSIVFGLLGLAIFIDWMALPRSAPLVGGLVLGLLTMPVIIISSRGAIASVPTSIREGASALGASRIQVLFDHVLPAAMPGILTGTILGLSRALGETAPLLMIGMVAFIVDVPSGFTDPATALPVQVYLWADSPELAFAERTSAAILVLLVFLLAMNFFALALRRRLESSR